MIPLSLAREGEKVRVSGVSGGRDLMRRLMDMGFHPGTEIEIISASRVGPLIVRLDGTRLGIGMGMARKIFVSPAR